MQDFESKIQETRSISSFPANRAGWKTHHLQFSLHVFSIWKWTVSSWFLEGIPVNSWVPLTLPPPPASEKSPKWFPQAVDEGNCADARRPSYQSWRNGRPSLVLRIRKMGEFHGLKDTTHIAMPENPPQKAGYSHLSLVFQPPKNNIRGPLRYRDRSMASNT